MATVNKSVNGDLTGWYSETYIRPNCYTVRYDPKIMKRCGTYFTMERLRGKHPMEPKRKMNKVRIWDGTPTQRFFGKVKIKK
tara:strand:- start:1918 stop:2163 length:246 start_codon:yes stop_codon:yes gene_type:complete